MESNKSIQVEQSQTAAALPVGNFSQVTYAGTLARNNSYYARVLFFEGILFIGLSIGLFFILYKGLIIPTRVEATKTATAILSLPFTLLGIYAIQLGYRFRRRAFRYYPD